ATLAAWMRLLGDPRPSGRRDGFRRSQEGGIGAPPLWGRPPCRSRSWLACTRRLETVDDELVGRALVDLPASRPASRAGRHTGLRFSHWQPHQAHGAPWAGVRSPGETGPSAQAVAD